VTKTLHIDKRAEQVAALGVGAEDELLTTAQVAAWLGVSVQFLEIGRSSGGYGPPYTRLAPRAIRYRRGDILQWLRDRTHVRTSEYRGEVQRRRKRDAGGAA
jgi:predicted DNA-binding transcriptional regulator AlpA